MAHFPNVGVLCVESADDVESRIINSPERERTSADDGLLPVQTEAASLVNFVGNPWFFWDADSIAA
jgi:hypothetical protein